VKTPLVSRAFVLAILALAAGCGSKPSPPGRLENVGGSSGREPDAATSGGTSGGGAEPEPVIDAGAPDPQGLDAGGDASLPDAGVDPDADGGARIEEGCVVDSIENECANAGCPDLDEAPEWLLAEDPPVVVRRPCEGADGTRYITIGRNYGFGGTGYIYDAESGELVSKYATSDVADFCTESTASSVGFYGRVVWDCASLNPNGVTTPCEDGPGGPGPGGPGAGGPGPGGPGPVDPSEECIYIND
jgi:hypothetical protein